MVSIEKQLGMESTEKNNFKFFVPVLETNMNVSNAGTFSLLEVR